MIKISTRISQTNANQIFSWRVQRFIAFMWHHSLIGRPTWQGKETSFLVHCGIAPVFHPTGVLPFFSQNAGQLLQTQASSVHAVPLSLLAVASSASSAAPTYEHISLNPPFKCSGQITPVLPSPRRWHCLFALTVKNFLSFSISDPSEQKYTELSGLQQTFSITAVSGERFPTWCKYRRVKWSCGRGFAVFTGWKSPVGAVFDSHEPRLPVCSHLFISSLRGDLNIPVWKQIKIHRH